ncbi:MAG: aldehyde dehydrogenase family protein [Bdellovibrionales bacterium]|nr:aldehyde dehydrogenase family protein [Bdellovibrionales bacterium]
MTRSQFISRDPSTGHVLREYPAHSPFEVQKKLARAQMQFHIWRKRSLAKRAEPLLHLADILLRRKTEVALMMTLEMGKPIAQSVLEVEKSVSAIRWLCERAGQALALDSLGADDGKTLHGFLKKDALGPVLGIMPWNFPLWQAIRFVIPTLLAGNVVLLKHASNVIGSLQLMTVLFREAGLEEGVFEELIISAEDALQLIKDPRVRGVSLSGSTAAGRAVGAAAGQALKPCLLELGGSDPYIVCADTDMNLAIEKCVAARLVNNGQSCVAGKRFIVHESVVNAFCEGALALLGQKVIADPRSPKTDLGPLAKADLIADLNSILEHSKKAGYEVIRSHSSVPAEGFYFSPALVRSVRPESVVCQQETFGPVMPVITFQSLEEALQIANHTPFGLGASIFTQSQAAVQEAARDLQAGMIFVNDFVRSDPRWPFGGVGDSGYGRELSDLGFLSFSNLKAVVVGETMRPIFEH